MRTKITEPQEGFNIVEKVTEHEFDWVSLEEKRGQSQPQATRFRVSAFLSSLSQLLLLRSINNGELDLQNIRSFTNFVSEESLDTFDYSNITFNKREVTWAVTLEQRDLNPKRQLQKCEANVH